MASVSLINWGNKEAESRTRQDSEGALAFPGQMLGQWRSPLSAGDGPGVTDGLIIQQGRLRLMKFSIRKH